MRIYILSNCKVPTSIIIIYYHVIKLLKYSYSLNKHKYGKKLAFGKEEKIYLVG